MATQMALRPMELLLVEDNAGDIRLTQEAFREARIPVNLRVVKDGAEACDFLHRTGAFEYAPRPDLILLDLNLPKKNGREVLSDIKADPDLRRIPVVVMSTSSAPEEIASAYTLNANCYITKPVDLDKFYEVARSIQDFWLQTVTLPEH